MATIFERKNKDNSVSYRVTIRRKGLTTFCLSFPTRKEAKDWVSCNEKKYIENPDWYLKRSEKIRLKLRHNKEFG